VQDYMTAAAERDKHIPRAQVEIIYKDSHGIQRKWMQWNRPKTDSALSEWIEDYLSMLAEGYHPAGFSTPPTPHCCRVHHLGKVVAEWYSNPKRPAESPVTAEPLGSGGIPNV